MTKKFDAPNEGHRFRTTVPEGQLRRLIEIQRAYSAESRKSRLRYPNPDRLDNLTLKAIKKLGFVGHDLKDLVDAAPLDVKGKGKGKGKKGSGSKGGRKLPDPNVVLSEVQSSLSNAGINPVILTSDAVSIEWNMEFLDETKARFFAPTYKAVFECCDVANLIEVSAKGMAELGKITGYLWFCSPENTRGQAVGFLVNPNRYDVIGQPQIWHEIGTVQGIPDLRPGFAITLKDKVTGVKTLRVVNHFKSMRGGPKVTEPVRYQQFKLLAKRLGTPVNGCKPRVGRYQLLQMFKNINVGRGLSDHAILFVTEKVDPGVKPVDGMCLIAGDFNDFIERNTHVTDPLTQAGYKLVYPTDSTSTQAMGGRLDGFFRDLSAGAACGGAGTGEFADDVTVAPIVVSLK